MACVFENDADFGEFVLVEDACALSAAFLMEFFMADALKRAQRVIFLACAWPKEHYATVLAKLGVHEVQERLYYLDYFSEELPESCMDIFLQMQKIVKECEAKGAKISIVMDDLEPLKWYYGRTQLMAFMYGCKAFTMEQHGLANVYALSHSDTDVDLEKTLNASLQDIASVCYMILPLPSGFSQEMDGMMTIQRRCKAFQAPKFPLSMPFKVNENFIRVIHRGNEALTML